MSAKDKAFNKSLILTEQRIAELARQRELDQTESLPVTYQGHDAATGTAKFSRGGDCCDCSIISGGETITTGAIAIGETVLSRPTEGNIRLDRKPSIANPTECGSGGSPSPRTFGGDGGGGGGKVVPEPGYTCPAKGTIKAGSRRTVGLAEQYEIYTGEKKSGVKIGGAPKELWEVCQTETVTIPNSPNAVSQSSPYSGRNGDDGCVNPAKPPKRCQWYEVDESDIFSESVLPDGMFNSGYVEFPEGTFRVLGCMIEDAPATEEGDGCDWKQAPQFWRIDFIFNDTPTGNTIPMALTVVSTTAPTLGEEFLLTGGQSGRRVTINPPPNVCLNITTGSVSGAYSHCANVTTSDGVIMHVLSGTSRPLAAAQTVTITFVSANPCNY